MLSLQDVLAQSAFCCRSYTRALMYLETYLMINPDAVQKNLGFLQVTIQKCYIMIHQLEVTKCPCGTSVYAYFDSITMFEVL